MFNQSRNLQINCCEGQKKLAGFLQNQFKKLSYYVLKQIWKLPKSTEINEVLDTDFMGGFFSVRNKIEGLQLVAIDL